MAKLYRFLRFQDARHNRNVTGRCRKSPFMQMSQAFRPMSCRFEKLRRFPLSQPAGRPYELTLLVSTVLVLIDIMQGHRKNYTYYSHTYSQYAGFNASCCNSLDDVILYLAYCDNFLFRGHLFSHKLSSYFIELSIVKANI